MEFCKLSMEKIYSIFSPSTSWFMGLGCQLLRVISPFDFGIYAPIVFGIFYMFFMHDLPLGFGFWGPQVSLLKYQDLLRQYLVSMARLVKIPKLDHLVKQVAYVRKIQQLSNGVLQVLFVFVRYKIDRRRQPNMCDSRTTLVLFCHEFHFETICIGSTSNFGMNLMCIKLVLKSHYNTSIVLL